MPPSCECSEDFGPCEQHADALVVRDGAALHSADELALLIVGDLKECGVQLSEADEAEFERLSNAIQSHLGVAFFPEPEDGGYSDTEAAQDLAQRVESNADGLWIVRDDGYVIYRPHPDCPLLEA